METRPQCLPRASKIDIVRILAYTAKGNRLMGFKQVKAQVIDCLNNGRIRHEQRGDIDVKNLLATGAVSPEEVAALIARARGGEYTCSPHHFDRQVAVHTVKIGRAGATWYIKWYFLEPNSVFISVHL